MSEDRTNVLCQITTQSIHETLGVSNFESENQEFVEGSFPLVYKQIILENRVEKLTKLIKPNQTLESISLLYPSLIF